MSRAKKNLIADLLEEKVPYYSALSSSNKEEFLKRVILYEGIMFYKGNNGFVCTQEVRTIIASGFVQLTFGFDNYLSRYFSKIHVTPIPYRHKDFNCDLLGHVDYPKRLIKLSWKDVLQGYELEDDGLNVVFHEMSHALEFEHRRWLKLYLNFRDFNFFFNLIAFFLKKRFCFFDEAGYQLWLSWARKDICKMRVNERHYLRQYAAKNIHEYLACALEEFFERGQEMKRVNSPLYNQLMFLLNQDPLNKSNPRLI